MDEPLAGRNASRSSSQTASVFHGFISRRQNVRLMLYGMLVLCDVAAIRSAFSVGGSMRGLEWISPHGIELGWLILPIHVLMGLRGGAYSLGAVQSRLDSCQWAWRCFIFATGLICILIYFQHSALLISRLAFGTSIALSLVFIALFRTVFLTVFVGKDHGWTLGELLIVDGPPPQGARPSDVHVLDAATAGLVPDIDDPDQLARMAEVVEKYDRVVVSCDSSEKRAAWAQMLKCFHVTGEVMLDDGSPLGAIGVDRFAGSDTVVVARGPMSLDNRLKKRTMDILLSAAALVFLAPLLLLIALLVKLDSPGPVFFAQPRVGRGNRMFRILKFRSMRTESSDLAGARSTTRDDDRVTRVGRVIRATSIDELPQLINVLKGDMSIVGPRPHALGSLAGDKLFWEVDNAYWRRHTLKPGITGLAQIRGFRGATHRQTDLENRLQSDLEYVNGWSLWRDIKIMIATLRVLTHREAY